MNVYLICLGFGIIGAGIWGAYQIWMAPPQGCTRHGTVECRDCGAMFGKEGKSDKELADEMLADLSTMSDEDFEEPSSASKAEPKCRCGQNAALLGHARGCPLDTASRPEGGAP